jgi:hypothetical protein
VKEATVKASRHIQTAAVLCILIQAALAAAPQIGIASGAPPPFPAADLSPSVIQGWGYDPQTTVLLLEMYHGGLPEGAGSVCWQLLSYVQRYRPTIDWTERVHRAYTVSRFGGGYHIRLNPRWQVDLLEAETRSRAASTLAHELRHALWNSLVNSNEEEYVCERTAGLAYEEMLRANGYTVEDAAFRARAVYSALRLDAATWIGLFKWAPLGFDWAWQSDRVRPVLDSLWSFLGLRPIGHPAAFSDRALGR